ncbi:MAG: hypothetical protein HPY44_18905 [Armatimonadetes bacterium]|nr:hypothetical protein [Armatimonadota bacterium]
MRKRHLDDTEWAHAERIANELHRAGCDHNELRKVLGMTREAQSAATMESIMELQKLRLQHRRSLARSSSTSGYWETVYQATRPLASMAPDRAALVLGWAVRILMGKPRTLTTGGRKQWQQNRGR